MQPEDAVQEVEPVWTPQTKAEVREFLEARTEAIRASMQSTVESLRQVGAELILAKNQVGHGEFLSWLQREFSWTESTAQRYMRVARAFGDRSLAAVDIPARAVYMLASPETPQDLRQEVLDRIENKGKLTEADVKRIVRQTKASQAGATEEEAGFTDATGQPVPKRLQGAWSFFEMWISPVVREARRLQVAWELMEEQLSLHNKGRKPESQLSLPKEVLDIGLALFGGGKKTVGALQEILAELIPYAVDKEALLGWISRAEFTARANQAQEAEASASGRKEALEDIEALAIE